MATRFHPASNVAKMARHPLTDEDRFPWLQAIADGSTSQRPASAPLSPARR
jgi:gluconate kinase